MCRKILSINLFLSVIFLLTTVFSPSLFSHETSSYTTDYDLEDNWIDESLDYRPVTYKKSRCPRCGMEFYYMPGKDSPHSHWVYYTVSEEERDSRLSSQDSKTKLKPDGAFFNKEKSRDKKEKKPLFDLGTQKEGVDFGAMRKDIEDKLTEKFEQKISEVRSTVPSPYERRQQLTCPYDGYKFFPKGEEIDDARLVQRSMVFDKPSIIEASFVKSIPFGVSKELRQFGYDLFVVSEQRKREEEEKTDITKGTAGALSTLGILKAAFTPMSSSVFSSETSTQRIAVVPIEPNYILGPGDMLVINVWGSIQESFPVEVDREGKIMLPKAGPLYVWGLKFQEAESRIKERLNQYYTNFNVDVSMGKLRNIQVFVIGEVKKPGSYIIDFRASIFQALYEAGGATKLGSLRKVKLMHVGGKTEEIDFYPYLLGGKRVEHSRIQSGDTVFVPTIGDVVAVSGNVKRPAIYETKSEITLGDLLGFAGGITPIGDLQRLQVERIEDNERRVMFDIELKRSDTGSILLGDISLRNGDLVVVSPIVRLKHNFVTILGNVERPGDYALSKDIKVSDLIKRAKGFLPGTYLHRAEVATVTKNGTRRIIPLNLDKMMLGAEKENVVLKEWDILLIYSEAEVRPPSFVEVDGSVNRPGKYELTPGMKISDLIFKAGGVKPKDVIRGAELFHIMPGEQPVVRNISIKRLSSIDISIDKDIVLRAGDALFIKSEPKLTERRVVTVKGEVQYPGTYSIMGGERLSSIIERAGGFTKQAFLEGAVFNRESIKKAQEKIRQHFIERENRTLLEEQQSILLRRTDRSGASISESLNVRRELLDSIASAEIEGRMVIYLRNASKSKGSKYDILLEDRDEIVIPRIPSAITVIGSVRNPASVPFEEKKTAEYYIRKTGGLTKHADKAGIYVLRANGEAVSKFMMSKRVERGATIIVPQEFRYWTPPGQLLRDTVEILSRIAVGIGIIAALD